MNKYNLNFARETIEQDKKRLINQLWKLIPMRENDEDWISHLKIVIEEITGLVNLYNNSLEGLVLLSKLEGLVSDVCEDFMIYRKTVFKCIDLLGRVVKDGQS